MRIEDAIERSSLGTTKARARRRTVPLASASHIVAAAATVRTATGRWGKAEAAAPIRRRGRSNRI
jgi:hypothetical protein